jgi:aspartate aminotransferase
MQLKLSKRAQDLSPSPLLVLDGRVKQLQAAGKNIINLGLGEPDFPTPQPIKQAGISAIQEDFSHYTPTAGIQELREKIAQKLLTENQLAYDPSQIVVGVGCRQLLFNAFQVLCNKGDEVLLATPTWISYIEQIKLAQAVPVLIELSAPFRLTAADVAAKISSKTKVLLLNSPANPTGAVIDPKELEKIAQLARKHNFWIISDEIYEKILYRGKHVSIASLDPEVKKQTITINGFSKSYAMTGWRVGYAAAEKNVIDAMVALQGHMTSNVCSIAQKASLGAFADDQSEVQEMLKQFRARRDMVMSALRQIQQLNAVEPDGAFYIFCSLEKVLGKKYQTAGEWCQALLEEKGVAVPSGEAFLSPQHFRISFAASTENLQEALKRIHQFAEDNEGQK